MDIDFLLKTKGVTKVELANRMGMQKQNINKMLKNPTEATIKKIAEALDVKMWELFATKEDINECVNNKNTSFLCPHCSKPVTISINLTK